MQCPSASSVDIFDGSWKSGQLSCRAADSLEVLLVGLSGSPAGSLLCIACVAPVADSLKQSRVEWTLRKNNLPRVRAESRAPTVGAVRRPGTQEFPSAVSPHSVPKSTFFSARAVRGHLHATVRRLTRMPTSGF